MVKAYYSFEPIQVNYECVSHGKHVNKIVTFFVAEVDGNVHLSHEEIEAGTWLRLDEAYQKLQFDNMKKTVEKLQKILRRNNETI